MGKKRSKLNVSATRKIMLFVTLDFVEKFRCMELYRQK